LSGFWRRAGLRRWLRFPEFLRGRRMRNLGVAVAAVVAVVAVVMGHVLPASSGPIAPRFRDRLARGGDQENLGDRYSVEVGGTVLERDEERAAPAASIRDIMVRDGEGVVVASAPRAEVGLAGFSC